MHASRLTRIGVLLAVPAFGALAGATLASTSAAATATTVSGSRPAAAAIMPGHARGGPAVTQTAIKPNAAAGYLWSEGSSYYAYNTAGKPVTITDNDPATGDYAVFFDGLQGIGDNGDVQVSSYQTEDTCSVLGWGPVSTTEEVDVACYTPSGALDTTGQLFDVTITDPHSVPSGQFAYAWINPDNRSYKLTGFGDYNSSHKVNQVKHLGTGSYELLFPGPKSSGVHGTVQVTPFGTGGGSCLASGWKGVKAGEEVFVHCYSAAGTAQDRTFTVVYAGANNLLGLNHATDANILASGKGSISAPVEDYLSARRAEAIVIDYYAGDYEVVLAGSEGNSKFGGDVQVNAVNSRDYHCYVFNWGQETTPAVNLYCLNLKGQDVSTPFTVQWVVP
jgi:hypothetical protein